MVHTRIPLSATSAGTALARVIRDARNLTGWSQAELALRSGTSKATIWRLEGNRARVLDLAVVEAVLKALGIVAALELDGRHLLDRERQRDAVHAWLNGRVARHLRRLGWTVATEVPLGGDAPRGWIDLLAFREADGALVVEETKSDLPDIGGLQRSLAFYERQAWRAAATLGWQPRRVVAVCVVLDSDQVASRIAGARDLLAVAFPGAVAALNGWLEDPAAEAPTGWCIAAADPASRARTWLRGTSLSRRKRPPAYRDYADAVRVLSEAAGVAPAARPRPLSARHATRGSPGSRPRSPSA